MLIRIKEVKGIGLLHDVHGPAYEFRRLALVYGENGRGKSTLSAIFSSCASGDAHMVQERATIDGSLDPSVSLLFEGNKHAEFKMGSWSGVRPEIVVFDAAFVRRHVYSGVEVTADNRKNLLDFALGSAAVSAREDEEQATNDRAIAATAKRTIEQKLQAHANEMPLRAFRNLDRVDDVDAAIAKIEDRLAVSRRETELRRQPLPEPVVVPSFAIDRVFSVLNRRLEDVEAEAEAIVAAHFERHDTSGLARWVGEGQQYDDGSSCPYCGQETTGIELIQMYRAHFSEAYQGLQGEVRNANDAIANEASDTIVDELRRGRERANERLAFWSEYAGTAQIDDNRDDLVLVSLRNVRLRLEKLLALKAVALGDAAGLPADRADVDEQWRQVEQVISDFNDTIAQKRDAIQRYLAALASEDVATIEQTVAMLKASKNRYSEPVEELFNELSKAETALQEAEVAKNQAREDLTSLMTATLSGYRESINRHLDRLGARFKITDIRTNFLGQAPRTDYGIELRGKDVALAGGTPSFATALSDGDKRTMAFAFFAASIEADTRLGEKIVVVDDPMSSLDRGRRHYTMSLLADLARDAGQLIVLAHDAYFLRELEMKARREGRAGEISHVKLARTTDDYTTLDKLDLARECESTYSRNYRMVRAFARGEQSDHVTAGAALRPLLEGHLHRRFPGSLPDAMLGHVITCIEDSQVDDPIHYAKASVPELRELSDFAGQFHHDTNPDYDPVSAPDATSVASYARRVLEVIHGAPLPAS